MTKRSLFLSMAILSTFEMLILFHVFFFLDCTEEGFTAEEGPSFGLSEKHVTIAKTSCLFVRFGHKTEGNKTLESKKVIKTTSDATFVDQKGRLCHVYPSGIPNVKGVQI